jgi:CRP-like cAMP-binding protein
VRQLPAEVSGPSNAILHKNRILAALPRDCLDRLRPDLSVFALPHGRVLFEANEDIEHVYFPVGGAVSIIADDPEGASVDVAIVGNEGFVGLPVFLGTHRMPMKAMAQVPGDALRMDSASFLREVDRGGELVSMLERYVQMRMVEMSQTILCNRVHPLEQRVARWLLELDDRVEEIPFELTQEFFAVMLGSPRPKVTTCAVELRERGLIDYSRGAIEILDHKRLEQVSCGCYRLVRDELDRLLSEEDATQGSLG